MMGWVHADVVVVVSVLDSVDCSDLDFDVSWLNLVDFGSGWIVVEDCSFV
jgi:hypothetical protein